MKKKILFFFCTAFIANVFAQEPITNRDIIMMKASKMSDDIILAKIAASTCDFDLTTSGILELKNAKITDKVVKEMLTASPPKEVMTNDDVINMVQAKLTSSVIMAKIEVTEHGFDVSPDGLIKLTTAKIPKSIVKKMMDAPTGGSSKDGVSEKSKGGGNITSYKVLRYEDVQNAIIPNLFSKDSREGYDEYVAKDGSVFKKGDKLKLNFPTKDGRAFQYIYQSSSRKGRVYLDAANSNRELEITHISVTKPPFNQGDDSKYVQMFLDGESWLIVDPCVEIENAIASGEVESKVITENKALENIKIAKDKFDLGLITEEEYTKVREEMKQYIK